MLGRDDAGTPVFNEPWEARIFAMVVSLHRAGAFEWKDFQRLLIDEIARSEADGKPRPDYLNWAMAAKQLFDWLDFASRAAIDERVAELRPEDRTIRLR
jgi:nitrile hydratase accessory protein